MTDSPNFRKTAKGYSADYQRNDGLGLERRYYGAPEVNHAAAQYKWASADDIVPGEGWTVAEMLIVGGVVAPYRVKAI